MMRVISASTLMVAILVFVISCATTPKPTHHGADIDRGLVAYWPMDKGDVDGPIIKDRLGKYNGVKKGGVTLMSGSVGEALELDGQNGYIEFGDILNNVFTSPAAKPKERVKKGGNLLELIAMIIGLWKTPEDQSQKRPKFSIATWVYPTKKGQQVNVLIKSGHSRCTPQKNERMFGIYMGNAARGDNALSFGTETNSLGAGVHSDTKLALPLNQWTHLVVNYDESNTMKQRITLWINGHKQNTTTRNRGDFVMHPSPAKLALGVAVGSDGSPCDLRGKDPHYAGGVDDLRIYDRLLSQVEVSQLFAMGQGEVSALRE